MNGRTLSVTVRPVNPLDPEGAVRYPPSAMVAIRLSRVGKRMHPTYRVVVSDKRKDTVGPFLEQLGTYDPHAPAESAAKLNADRVRHWLSVGATASPSVHNLLVAAKLVEAKAIPLGRIRKTAAEGGEAKPAAAPKAETKPEEPKTEAKAEAPKPEPTPAA